MSAFIVGLAMSILWVSSSVSGDRSHLDVVGLPVSFADSDPSKWRHSALLDVTDTTGKPVEQGEGSSDMYSSYGSRDCSGEPRCIFHQSVLPSFTVVDLVRTVFAVPGVCKMTTVTGIRWFSAMFGSTVDTNS